MTQGREEMGMRRAGKIGMLLAVFLIAAGGALPQRGNEVLLRFEQVVAEQVTFRFWVPVDAVADLYPQPLAPAAPRSDGLSAPPPAGMVESRLVIRIGSFSYPGVGGETVERRILDGYWLLAADLPEAYNPGAGADAALLLEYYCSSPALAALLAEAGVPVSPVDGEVEFRLRPDGSEVVEGSAVTEPHGEWRIRGVTTDGRRYDTGASVVRLYYLADGELRALEILEADDYRMRATGGIEFLGASPLDNWPDWRWADDSAEFQYNTNNAHQVLRVTEP